MADVEAIHREHALALLDSGESIPITNWFDGDGDDCNQPYAHFAVAGPDKSGRWHAIDLDQFERGKLH